MIRVHKSNVVPKYRSGHWFWCERSDNLHHKSYESEPGIKVQPSSNFHFKTTLNQEEEVIYRQEFTRPDNTFDADVILIQDIKNLVLFLAPSEILTNKLINFIHTKTVDWFLNALIIYFEHFIRLVEFILIRRDETSGNTAQVESSESLIIKRIYSEYLSQYRLVLGREYSSILLGNGEMKQFYHTRPVVNISKTRKDQFFHEAFLAICTQIVWIAHHRKAYHVIDDEMNRLFRSDFFKLTRQNTIKFDVVEQELLFGKNCRRTNFRYQNSPVIQEVVNVSRRNLPVLWIGEKKYRGNDLRLQELEMEIIIPDSQLNLIDVSHGILGHPKGLYNTLLMLDQDQVRRKGYSENYDPYRLVKQPILKIPKLDALERTYKQLESHFTLKDNRYEYTAELIRKWKNRDEIIENVKSKGLLINVVSKCRKEVEQIGRSKGRTIMQTTAQFVALKQKMRKRQ